MNIVLTVCYGKSAETCDIYFYLNAFTLMEAGQ